MKKFWSFLLILLMVSCCGCSKPPQTLTVSVYGGETEINHYEEIENGFLSALEASGWYIACPTDGCYIPYKIGDYQMRDGTVFLSYMVYNPDNNYIDDIMERYDFILDRGLEVGGMYEFRHINGHIEVFLDGEFQFSADTMQEAYSELKAG